MSSSASIPSLLSSINDQAALLNRGDAKARKPLLATVRALYSALETPMETILRWEWAELSLRAAIRTGIDLGLFYKLSEQPQSAAKLAQATGADVELLARILKHLAAMHVVREAGSDTYSATPLSIALTEQIYVDSLKQTALAPAFAALPQYLFSTKYANPNDPSRSAFQQGMQTPHHFFAWLQENPEAAAQFNNYMAGYSRSRARWTDDGCVPLDDVLGKGASASNDAVLLVDIGGGSGQDIELFQKRRGELPGRIVLQDLPAVIQACKSGLSPGIEAMGYDFFTPQPLLGARAYYLHSVLHDWPDEKCREILRNITSVMKKGYSKILINENVVPSTSAHWETTGLDIIMMTLFSSVERHEASWRALLASVGLRIVKIWSYEVGTESLIEAELE